MYQLAVITLFPAAVIFAATMDLLSMTIPNRICLALVAAFLILAPFTGMSMTQFGNHVAAGAIVLAITFAMFAAGVFGGGDAKLVSAVALWVGLSHLMEYLLLSAVCGGVLAVAFLMFRGVPLPLALTRHEWLLRLHTPKGPIPYGVALAAGGLMIYPQTGWMLGFVA